MEVLGCSGEGFKDLQVLWGLEFWIGGTQVWLWTTQVWLWAGYGAGKGSQNAGGSGMGVLLNRSCTSPGQKRGCSRCTLDLFVPSLWEKSVEGHHVEACMRVYLVFTWLHEASSQFL